MSPVPVFASIVMTSTGSCHCGRIAFTVDGTPDDAMSCNCSICQRKGALMWFVPKAQFHLKTPVSDAFEYRFNKHVIAHRFCPTCGIHPYGEGVDPKGNAMVAINVRCLDGIDLKTLPITEFDGRAM